MNSSYYEQIYRYVYHIVKYPSLVVGWSTCRPATFIFSPAPEDWTVADVGHTAPVGQIEKEKRW